jgi:regulator of sirC expression with transglutaminase-like and TPR domain
MNPKDARRALKKLLADPLENWDLAQAALLLACEFELDLQPGAYLARLDQWSATLKARLPENPDPVAALDTLARFMADELGFNGNRENFSDSANSFLNQVMDRRAGIPITLSILYISLAERLGLPLVGVPVPGHFVVAVKGQPVWFDPFEGGKRLNREDLLVIVERLFGPSTRLTSAMLKPQSKRLILARLVRNLKYTYATLHDLPHLLTCTDLGLALEPQEPELIMERGLVRYQLGQYHTALHDIRSFLKKVPAKSSARGEDEEEDAGRRHLEMLQRVLSSMN